MSSAIVDPLILACPRVVEGEDAILSFIAGLLEWRDLPHRCVRTYKPAATVDFLAEAGAYPLFAPIRDALIAARIADVEPRDVVAIANGLLVNLAEAESALGLQDLLFDDPVVEPGGAFGARHEALKRGLDQSLVLTVLFQKRGGGGDTHHVLTRDCPAESVQVQTTVIDWEPSLGDVPQPLSGKVSIACSQSALSEALDPVHIWLAGAMSGDRAEALRLLVEITARAQGLVPSGWRIGHEFMASAENLGFMAERPRAQRLLRACAETVFRQSLTSTHALRMSQGGNAPQRRRVGRPREGAWRRDVDHEFHLHYWDGPDGIELALVVSHKDMRIPD